MNETATDYVHRPPSPGQLSLLAREAIRHQSGHCFTIRVPGFGKSDSEGQDSASHLRLFEDGIELGPAHALHALIAKAGNGLFSHWDDTLYFSSSDNSCCQSNGRTYHVLWEREQQALEPDGFPICSLPLNVLRNLQPGILSHQYRGIYCCKCPFDMALYQKLLWEVKPRTILELGTWYGGSALWFADMLTSFSIDGHVHTFDIQEPPAWRDPRITFHKCDILHIADFIAPDWVAQLPRPLLVIDDAGHRYDMTMNILRHFAPLMLQNEYLIVEDAIAYEMLCADQYNGGPRRAIIEFLKNNKEFIVDYGYCNYYGNNVTWNVNGYLRHV
jgi:cephalosporin hydroxylase